MSEDTLVVTATADDVEYYARRRCRDEHAQRLYLHLAHTAPNGAFVAKDAGTPIGIAIAHQLEDELFVSELFVEPSFRQQGIGAELLLAAAGEAEDVSRSVVFQAQEHAAAAFFLRRGVAAQTPVFRISGSIPHPNELARMAAGDRFGTDELQPVHHRPALSQLDREVRGSARPADHLYFAEHGRGFVFRRGEELAGYAYVWPNGCIGPLAAASQTYLVQFLAFALATLRETYGASWCTMLVPGTNLRTARAAMRAGLRIESTELFASESGLPDLSRYIAFNEVLF